MSVSLPLVETLAQRMFTAEYGSMGLRWDDMSDDAHNEWMRKASSVLAGLYDTRNRYIVLVPEADELHLVDRVDFDS